MPSRAPSGTLRAPLGVTVRGHPGVTDGGLLRWAESGFVWELSQSGPPDPAGPGDHRAFEPGPSVDAAGRFEVVTDPAAWRAGLPADVAALLEREPLAFVSYTTEQGALQLIDEGTRLVPR